jgi:hypothetical protein
LKNKKKPSVTFFRATLNDCVRTDGLALDIRFIEPIAAPAPILHLPQDIIIPIPSDLLVENLLTLQKLFVLNNEKACRMLIDAILIEVFFLA